MRKYIKTQVLDLLQTIIEGVLYVKDADAHNGLMVLEDCQNAVGMLEEIFRENIANIELSSLTDELINCNNVALVIKELKMADKRCEDEARKFIEILNKIKNIIQAEKEKYEIVFLPYKASMWDSMESIWEAAAADDDCEVYVVPIPYYDRNADLSLGTMHYEGNEFAEKVTVTSYLDYDIENIHPDIIYIHNPYDASNYVTSVDPRYYSDKLKNYTDMLVYVPYFVSREMLLRNSSIVPAMINADRVIVQSEKAKQITLDVLAKHINAKSQRERESILKVVSDKLLPMGSPKFDGIINRQKENIELPMEWKEIIGDRKIILYNVSVAGLLVGNEDVLTKIKDVFAFMRDREDVVLWWRPHPLNKATCASMRSRLLEEYSELEAAYKSEKIGVYDDTADVSRAIVMADMYYGTSSSLVELFSITGKPVVYQSNYALREVGRYDKRTSAYCYKCLLDGNDIWFMSGNFNGLFKYMKDRNETVYMGTVPNEDGLAENLYQQILKIDNSLWLIPSKAQELAEYNIETGEFYKYRLPEEVLTKSQKYVEAYWYKDKIVMVSTGESGILIFDLKSKEMKVYNSFVNHLKVIHPSFVFPNKGCLVRDRIYLITQYDNKIIEFDLKTKKYKIHSLEIAPDEFHGIRHDGKNFIIVSSNGLLRWDKKKLTQYKIEALEEEKSLFRDVVVHKDDMYILATVKNCIYKVKGKKVEEIKLFDDGESGWNCFNMFQCENKLIMIFSKARENTRLIMIDMENGSLEEKDLMLPASVNEIKFTESVFERFRNANYNNAEWYPLWESNFVNLMKITDDLVSEETISKEQMEAYKAMYANVDGRAGVKIHEKIVEEIEKKK